MGQSVSSITKQLKKDLIKYGNSVAKNMAQTIADELTEEARCAIEDFYNSYNPQYYTRHYNFRDSYKRYYRNHGDHFTAGVELMESNIPNVYSDPVDEVFMRVYHGFHGYAGIFDNNIYDVIDRNTNLPTGATAQHRGSIPPRMVPPPIERLLNKRDEIVSNISIYQGNASQIAKRNSYTYLKF